MLSSWLVRVGEREGHTTGSICGLCVCVSPLPHDGSAAQRCRAKTEGQRGDIETEQPSGATKWRS